MSAGVLLDTNVVSELVKAKADARVVAYVGRQHSAWLSVLTLHELTWGAERLADLPMRASLVGWIASLRSRFAHRLIELDADTAEHAGRLRARAAQGGRVVDAIDALLAASAAVRGLGVATRNVRDFLPLGVRVEDPWSL